MRICVPTQGRAAAVSDSPTGICLADWLEFADQPPFVPKDGIRLSTLHVEVVGETTENRLSIALKDTICTNCRYNKACAMRRTACGEFVDWVKTGRWARPARGESFEPERTPSRRLYRLAMAA